MSPKGVVVVVVGSLLLHPCRHVNVGTAALKDSSVLLGRAVALGTAARSAVDIFFKCRLKRPAERGSARAQDPVSAPHANRPLLLALTG